MILNYICTTDKLHWLARVVCPGALLFLGSAHAFGITLQDALAAAYNGNPQILAERAALRAKDEKYNQAIANDRPTFQISASQGASFNRVTGGTVSENQFYGSQIPGRSLALTGTQTLYSGGRARAELQAAMSDINAERSRLASIEQKVFTVVATDYCDVLRDTARLDLQKSYQLFLDEKLRAASAEMQAGAANKVDVSQAAAGSAQAAIGVLESKATLNTSELSFERDVGLPADKLEYPPDQFLRRLIPKTPMEAADLAVKNNPDIKVAEFDELASVYERDGIIDQAMPQLSAQTNISHTEDQLFRHEKEDGAGVMLHLTLNLYSGGILESQARAATQTAASLRNTLEATRLQETFQARSSWNQEEADTNSLSIFSEEVAANTISLEGVQRQQESGEKILLDVLNARQTLLQSQVAMNDMWHDRMVAEFTLAGAMGMATARALGLNVELYNVDDHFNQISTQWFGFGDDP